MYWCLISGPRFMETLKEANNFCKLAGAESLQRSSTPCPLLAASPKAPCTYMVATWALNRLLCQDSVAHVYTEWILAPLVLPLNVGQSCRDTSPAAFAVVAHESQPSDVPVISKATLRALGPYYTPCFLVT